MKIKKEKYNMLDKIKFKIVQLLPKWVVYYCALRMAEHATNGKHRMTVMSELYMAEALKRWEEQ
jgi:hypothetical protein